MKPWRSPEDWSSAGLDPGVVFHAAEATMRSRSPKAMPAQFTNWTTTPPLSSNVRHARGRCTWPTTSFTGLVYPGRDLLPVWTAYLDAATLSSSRPLDDYEKRSATQGRCERGPGRNTLEVNGSCRHPSR